MGLRFWVFLSLFVVSNARADVIGKFTQEQDDSSVQIILLTNNVSTHPECKGELEALGFRKGTLSDSPYPYARGCWSNPNPGSNISIHLYSYVDGHEISAYPDPADMSFSPEYVNQFKKPIKDSGNAGLDEKKEQGTSSSDEIYDNVQSMRDDTSMYYAGMCHAMRLALSKAKTPEQKQIVGVIEDEILKESGDDLAYLSEYCDAKLRIYSASKR